jgi:hypothetical protein
MGESWRWFTKERYTVMATSISTELNTLALQRDHVSQNVKSPRRVVALPGRSVLRIEPKEGLRRLSCTFGSVWVTVEGSITDTILGAGESFDLPRKGLVVVEALSNSAVQIV